MLVLDQSMFHSVHSTSQIFQPDVEFVLAVALLYLLHHLGNIGLEVDQQVREAAMKWIIEQRCPDSFDNRSPICPLLKGLRRRYRHLRRWYGPE